MWLLLIQIFSKYCSSAVAHGSANPFRSSLSRKLLVQKNLIEVCPQFLFTKKQTRRALSIERIPLPRPSSL